MRVPPDGHGEEGGAGRSLGSLAASLSRLAEGVGKPGFGH